MICGHSHGHSPLCWAECLHSFEANTVFLDGSLEQFNPGGVYVIEDIFREIIEGWHHQLEMIYSKRWPDCAFALVELPKFIE